jgi:hemerythrin superfamily protein
MDIFDVLKEDHGKVKDLFEKLEGTTERAVKTREELFSAINEDLTLHAEMEEKLFYPRFKEEEETRELVLEAFEEHAVVKRLLKELDIPSKGEEWAAKAKVLMENVRHHIEEEEGELFKKCRKVLSREESEAMAEEALEFKATAKA